MFAFAWTISTYQTIKSVILLLFLLGEVLAKECLNEISHKHKYPFAFYCYHTVLDLLPAYMGIFSCS